MRTIAVAAAGALALTGLGTSPAAAQAVVVRASGPSAGQFPAGRKLAAGAKVSLNAGDVVTVLDQVGTRVLKGKQTFTIDSRVARDGLVGMLARSLTNPTTVRAGAVRGAVLPVAMAPMIPRSVWIADIDRGGKVCVPQGSGLYLWRGANETRRVTSLGETEGGAVVQLLFPPRTSGVGWPSASLPLLAGRSYRLTEEGAADKAVEFEIVSLAPDAVPDSAADLGTILLANGCVVQAEALADTLERLSGDETPAS